MDDLTVDNFVEKIKQMDNRERNKLKVPRLIELICELPDRNNCDLATLASQLTELKASVDNNTKLAAVNKNEIVALNAQNETLVKQNTVLRLEVDVLKTHARECRTREENRPPPPPAPATEDATIDGLRKEIVEIQAELNNIQQYLRVNNLEIVGLPEPNENEAEETLIVNALNNLAGIDVPIRHEDIDISHPLPSNRKDGKAVHVVRFISRKTKGMILSAKKQAANKQYKFRNKDVYINEHLSKQNRSLFAKAQGQKTALEYKYCWTRGGVINLRKTDNSQIVTITCEEDLANLTR